jgi:hypothetical protein
MADLVHDVRQRRSRLEHQADVGAPQRVRGDLRQQREPATVANHVGSDDDRREDPLSHAVLVARAAAVGGKDEVVDAPRLALGAPRVPGRQRQRESARHRPRAKPIGPDDITDPERSFSLSEQSGSVKAGAKALAFRAHWRSLLAPSRMFVTVRRRGSRQLLVRRDSRPVSSRQA